MNKTSKHYLLVDDDDIFNLLHKDIIQQFDENSIITSFNSSQKCLNYLDMLIQQNEEFPDYLFIDIRMPEMNGLELLNEFMKLPREKFSNTKLFVVTSSLDQRDRRVAMSFPIVTDFIVKMITEETLEEIIGRN